jgi:hypothetical protein
MFDFLRRWSISAKAAASNTKAIEQLTFNDLPPLRDDNPGQAPNLVLRAEDGEGSDLNFDLTELLQRSLEESGVPSKRVANALELDNGLLLQALFLEMEGDLGRIRTATTIQVNHASLCPDGIFEFQHAHGADPETALLNGFRNWALMDRLALCDALEREPIACTTMRMTLADGRERRIVFGPFSHYIAEPPEAGTEAAEEVEKFCPCCLFTNCIETMKPLIESAHTVGLRLFASLSSDGSQADCRANGLDYPEGAEALRGYASDWLPKGEIEFRKQYVVIHDFADD